MILSVYVQTQEAEIELLVHQQFQSGRMEVPAQLCKNNDLFNAMLQ